MKLLSIGLQLSPIDLLKVINDFQLDGLSEYRLPGDSKAEVAIYSKNWQIYVFIGG